MDFSCVSRACQSPCKRSRTVSSAAMHPSTILAAMLWSSVVFLMGRIVQAHLWCVVRRIGRLTSRVQVENSPARTADALKYVRTPIGGCCDDSAERLTENPTLHPLPTALSIGNGCSSSQRTSRCPCRILRLPRNFYQARTLDDGLVTCIYTHLTSSTIRHVRGEEEIQGPGLLFSWPLMSTSLLQRD